MLNHNRPRPEPGEASAPGSLWLTNAHVVDVRTGDLRRDRNVEITGGRVARITAEAPAPGERTVDLGGRYLVPGLISVHTHLSVLYPFSDADDDEDSATTVLRAAARARDALNAGVTTVRTLGEQNRADLMLRAAAAEGWAPAPRIVGAGLAVSTTGGHGKGGLSVFADGHDAFLRAARAELDAGADHIKIFITGGIAHLGETFNSSQTSPEEMRAAVRAAREHGTYVVAHAGGSGAIREALACGVRGFEHGYDLDGETIAQMARHRAFLTPTLTVTRCPDWMRAHDFTEWQIELAMEVGPRHLDSIRRAVAQGLNTTGDPEAPGITIVTGTDYPPGEPMDGTVTQVREMQFLTDAGLSPLQSLQAATVNAARLVMLDHEIGLVEEGYVADLIAVGSDPTSDIAALHDIPLVVQGGRVVRDDLPAAPTGGQQ
ncbi:amidohydrolase family protein [Thermobifida halotolerans]|uniref:Amidohydrolase family protein n=1 Tax=Thermobifida halotolerans TaxID=483545 RepID=A0AA97LY32_9ACTN|nr:amidohydrolase family protein [Thermobifida halotolerans]UOE20367.1 amidohydrolase family protein [Thermobifida halotolerans]